MNTTPDPVCLRCEKRPLDLFLNAREGFCSRCAWMVVHNATDTPEEDEDE